jgi:D-3-phosphoglycerate dehydrogenase
MAHRIVVSDPLSEAGLARLRADPSVELDYRPGLDEAKLCEAVRGADALVVRSGSQVTARVIAAADRLKVIGRAGIGVDNVDVPAASKRGVVVMNTPTGNAVTTAEHTLALIFSLARWIAQADGALKQGRWEKKKFEGRELAGKTLAVIGLGTIGRLVAERAKALRMRVVTYDPVLTAERAAALGLELTDLDAIWREADVITVHTPLTPQTRHLVGDAVVDKLKKGVLLVNCARGGIFDEAAVLRGLESGRIGGAAFDVFDPEPPPADSALVKHPRVVCTPHLGASTREAQERVAVEIVEQVLSFLASGEVRNAVNVPSISGELAAKVAPYIEMAERLGAFVAQVEPLVPRTVEIECVGEAASLGVELISAAAVGGLLRHYVDEPVNRVSAPHVAADRGITVREIKSTASSHAFATLVRVRVIGADAEERVVAGSLGTDRSPRLVQWGDFDIEAGLGGHALVVASADKPGVIGFIGTTLGGAGINIASVHLGKSSAGHALSVWNLDDAVPESVLAEVRASGNVSRALAIRL